jgi:RNA polymerase sigma factor (sigma-70 family)
MTDPAAFIHSSDQEILNNLVMGDAGRKKGEDMLFHTYMYFIREGVKKFRITEEESFDAYSETILSALEKIREGSFRGHSSLKTFLFRIFQNKCVDFIRKKTTKKYSVHQTLSIADLSLQLSDAAKSAIQHMIDRTDFDLLRQRLHELGEKCMQLLLLSAEGYTDKVIARELEYKTADVVKTSRLRCLEKLRQLYKQ